MAIKRISYVHTYLLGLVVVLIALSIVTAPQWIVGNDTPTAAAIISYEEMYPNESAELPVDNITDSDLVEESSNHS
jgi:hypothetical protein